MQKKVYRWTGICSAATETLKRQMSLNWGSQPEERSPYH